MQLITRRYSSTPIHPLLCETGQTLASIVLDSRQTSYAYRLLSFLDEYQAKKILPNSLRRGDRTIEELPENNLI